jgi:hypothetical protein
MNQQYNNLTMDRHLKLMIGNKFMDRNYQYQHRFYIKDFGNRIKQTLVNQLLNQSIMILYVYL